MTQSSGTPSISELNAEIEQGPAQKKNNTHWLYLSVIIAVILGIIFGLVAPDVAVNFAILGKVFIKLITMMIAPVIFCTVAIGIGSVKSASSVGKVGGLALGYFIVMSTIALFIGLAVGNIIKPGSSLNIPQSTVDPSQTGAQDHGGVSAFLMDIIPSSFFEPFSSGKILSALFIALLAGFAIQGLGKTGESILHFLTKLQALVFKVLTMILWTAPIGAFGAMAGVVGNTGFDAVKQLFILMLAFYLTCILFIGLLLGPLLLVIAKQNIFKLIRFLAPEYLIIVGTSSSESALPQLMRKMEFAGVEKSTVGIVVPVGYSFNLDGTAIYLTMASIFISDAMHLPMSISEQLGLLVIMMIASKGAAAVVGSALASLTAGLQAYKPALVGGVDVIVGIDRFMAEARALTNFTGNAVATFLVGAWTKTLDPSRAHQVLNKEIIYDDSAPVEH